METIKNHVVGRLRQEKTSSADSGGNPYTDFYGDPFGVEAYAATCGKSLRRDRIKPRQKRFEPNSH